MIGELINGRYRIECEAGSGGMADVYKAHDLKTDRTVALKVIKKDYCRDPKYVSFISPVVEISTFCGFTSR